MWLPGKVMLICQLIAPLKVVLFVPSPFIRSRFIEDCIKLKDRHLKQIIRLDENNGSKVLVFRPDRCHPLIPDPKHHLADLIGIGFPDNIDIIRITRGITA